MTTTKLEKMEQQAAELRKKIAQERLRSARKNRAELDAKILAAVHTEQSTYPLFNRVDFLNELKALFPQKSVPQTETQTAIISTTEPDV